MKLLRFYTAYGLAVMIGASIFLSELKPAQAELVPPPAKDFSKKNTCTSISRKGTIKENSSLYANPLSPLISARIGKYKKKVTIKASYKAANGERWLKIVLDDGRQGWTPQSSLMGAVDSRTFTLRHRRAIKNIAGVLKKFDANRPVIFWTFPNSGEIYAQTNIDPQLGLNYDQICIDNKKRKWGHIPYYRSMRDIWVCLNLPHETSL
ncbi:MAG: hypothetical protein ACI376_09715 [Candidatus Bruticola sp.]